MKRLGIVLAVVMLVPLTLPAAVPSAQATPPEWCLAVNPGQPTCSFTVMGQPEVISGAIGAGSWVIKVKRGKLTTTYTSPTDGSPTAISFALQKGDKVSAKANSPGSAVITGFPY